jgi:hypothetical protein
MVVMSSLKLSASSRVYSKSHERILHVGISVSIGMIAMRASSVSQANHSNATSQLQTRVLLGNNMVDVSQGSLASSWDIVGGLNYCSFLIAVFLALGFGSDVVHLRITIAVAGTIPYCHGSCA